LAGVWARGASKKNGDPYLFLQPLKIASSNLVHNLGLGLAYQKRHLVPKLAGVWARGASKKFGTPYVFLQPLKLATNFGWFRGSVVERRSLTGELSLSCARPTADG